jgi:NADH-quinone oxidoreductase subunit M
MVFESSLPVMLTALLLPIIVALILAIFVVSKRHLSLKATGIISSATLAASFLILLFELTQALTHSWQVLEPHSWILYASGPTSTVGVNFDLFADWISLPLALFILLISTISSIYSIKYMEGRQYPELYYLCLLFFAVGMTGAALATNLIQFFIFFEGMNIPALFLVAIWGRKKAKIIAEKYILYMVGGALSLLAGSLWLFSYSHTFDFANLSAIGVTGLPRTGGATPVPASILPVIGLLMFIGFAVKMGIFPFHSWLPDFHGEAPAPISALLSGVMVKLGVYGILRVIIPFFTPQIMNAQAILLGLGLFSMIWGAAMALAQDDFKRLLAYSTVNQMGYIMLGLFSMTPLGLAGGILHIYTHGVAKSSLFYSAGALEHSTGTRLIKKLGGVATKLPITAAVSLVGALSIAGTPPLGGFQSEWMLFTGTFQAGFNYIVAVGLLTTILTAGYYLWTIRRIFYGEESEEHKQLVGGSSSGDEAGEESVKSFDAIHESPWSMVLPMFLLALAVILLGIYPTFILNAIAPNVQNIYFTGGP